MRIIRSATAALVLATGLVVGSSAWADNPQQQDPNVSGTNQAAGSTTPRTAQKPGATEKQGTTAQADKKFLDDAYNSASAELEIGQLASDKGSTDAVKDLGKKIVDDEQRQLADLKGIIQKNGLEMPKPEAKYDTEVTRLTKLSGTAFDRAFLAHARSHEQAMLNEFQKESKDGKNPDLQTYAAAQITVLKAHIDQAKNVGVTNAQPQNQPQKGQTNKQPGTTNQQPRNEQPQNQQPQK